MNDVINCGPSADSLPCRIVDKPLAVAASPAWVVCEQKPDASAAEVSDYFDHRPAPLFATCKQYDYLSGYGPDTAAAVDRAAVGLH